MVDVFPLGGGCFWLQFEPPSQAEQFSARGPLDFRRAFSYLYQWRQGMDLSVLGQGVAVTVMFPGLLRELIPYVMEISRSLGYVLPSDCQDISAKTGQ